MERKIRPSQRWSIFQSVVDFTAEGLEKMRRNLQPDKFKEVYEALKNEKTLIEESDRPLNSFDKNSRFQKIYQNELRSNMIDMEGTKL